MVADVMDRHVMSNGTLSAMVKSDGAELCSLRDTAGDEMLWQAASIWPRHAPVLFPIVGRLKNDTLRHDGKAYRLTQHGFARDKRFAWLNRSPTACRLVLHEDAETRAVYPFAFRLEIAFALDDDAIEQSFTVGQSRTRRIAGVARRPSRLCLAACRWRGKGGARARVRRAGDRAGPAPGRRLAAARAEPTPVAGSTLALDPALFEADALILPDPASRSVRYTAPGAPAIEVAWEGFSDLGLWSRTGADFLCIEPWHGTASPTDFDGEFLDKPGLMLIPPGERRTLSMRIRLC